MTHHELSFGIKFDSKIEGQKTSTFGFVLYIIKIFTFLYLQFNKSNVKMYTLKSAKNVLVSWAFIYFVCCYIRRAV